MNKEKWVAFRVDGSTAIGTGHIMRCLTIANALSIRGLKSVFFSRSLEGSLIDWVEKAGHDIVNLPNLKMPATGQQNNEYGHWLSTTEPGDARQTIEAMNSYDHYPENPDLLIVDHYAIGETWERIFNDAGIAPICAIDDLDRSHDCKFLLDTTYGKTADNYCGKVPTNCHLMIGAKYALLRPEFARVRSTALKRHDENFSANKPVENLLISMGGVDLENATLWALNAVKPLCELYGFHTHILVGGAYPHTSVLEKEADSFPGQITIHKNISDVAGLLKKMDLCIGASGSSTWERCCLGLPTVNLVTARNQQQIASVLSSEGVVIDGGHYTSTVANIGASQWGNKIIAPLLQQPIARKKLSKKARSITEGYGVGYQISCLFSLDVGRRSIQLRKANMQDIELVYEWQCYPNTRRYAVNSGIPSWPEHKIWMEKKLQDTASLFYIVLANNIPAGLLRLDSVGEGIEKFSDSKLASEISILTAPEFYGKNVAKFALEKILKMHGDLAIIARVLVDNTASLALFKGAGFVRCGNEYFIFRSPMEQDSNR